MEKIWILCGGSRNINFKIAEDETQISIKCTWPKAIYQTELFEKAKQNGAQKLANQLHTFVTRHFFLIEE